MGELSLSLAQINYLTNLSKLMTIESMTPAVIRPLQKGDLVYYASPLATHNDFPYLSQLTQVEKVSNTTIFLDNGKKFSIERKEEICRGESGCLYEYSAFNKAIVKESEAKLSVLKSVEAIDFSSLSSQQLSMILDVSRGAFTLVTNSSPCGGGCSDTMESDGQSVQISGLAFDVDDTSILPVIFADATFELSDSDECEDDEDDDEDYDLAPSLQDTLIAGQ